jgi:hypothetical protein
MWGAAVDSRCSAGHEPASLTRRPADPLVGILWAPGCTGLLLGLPFGSLLLLALSLTSQDPREWPGHGALPSAPPSPALSVIPLVMACLPHSGLKEFYIVSCDLFSRWTVPQTSTPFLQC